MSNLLVSGNSLIPSIVFVKSYLALLNKLALKYSWERLKNYIVIRISKMDTLQFICTRMFLDTYDKSDFSTESAVCGSVITLLLVHSVMIWSMLMKFWSESKMYSSKNVTLVTFSAFLVFGFYLEICTSVQGMYPCLSSCLQKVDFLLYQNCIT